MLKVPFGLLYAKVKLLSLRWTYRRCVTNCESFQDASISGHIASFRQGMTYWTAIQVKNKPANA